MARLSLQDTTVLRCGATARRWNQETRDVSCEANGDKIELRFSMSASGGTTDVLLQIGSRDFALIAKTMCMVDRQSAMISMAAELAREVAEQPNYDGGLMQRAQRAVIDLAHDKLLQAPQGEDDAQWLILNSVKKLVEELSPKQERGANAA